MLPAFLLVSSLFLVVRGRPSQDTHRAVARGLPTNPIPADSIAAHADDDPAHLKFDIIAIVGVYLFWLAVTLTLIGVIRRRSRQRSRLVVNRVVAMKPIVTPATYGDSGASNIGVKSPTWSSFSSLKSPTSGVFSGLKKGRKSQSKTNTSEYSISTVTSVGHDAHRQKDMDTLADLYAQVMLQDEVKSATETVTPVSPGYPPKSPRYPPEFAHLQNAQPLCHPLAPTPVNDHFPQDSHYRQPSRSTIGSTKTPLSIISTGGPQSPGLMSPRNFSRPSVSTKETRISQPIYSPGLPVDNQYVDSVPLSPRLYNPGPPPPTPDQRKKYPYARYGDAEEIEPLSQHAPEMPALRMLPPAPATGGLPLSPAQSVGQSAFRERRAPPSALNLRAMPSPPPPVPSNNGAQTAKPKALPFREVYGDTSLRSAPPTKTTFLDRPSKHQAGGANAVSQTPRTGVVPQTPYSPYMPYTPMTPITPRRLATKQDLKKLKKEQKLRTLTEDDLVESDDDMWGKVR